MVSRCCAIPVANPLLENTETVTSEKYCCKWQVVLRVSASVLPPILSKIFKLCRHIWSMNTQTYRKVCENIRSRLVPPSINQSMIQPIASTGCAAQPAPRFQAASTTSGSLRRIFVWLRGEDIINRTAVARGVDSYLLFEYPQAHFVTDRSVWLLCTTWSGAQRSRSNKYLWLYLWKVRPLREGSAAPEETTQPCKIWTPLRNSYISRTPSHSVH